MPMENDQPADMNAGDESNSGDNTAEFDMVTKDYDSAKLQDLAAYIDGKLSDDTDSQEADDNAKEEADETGALESKNSTANGQNDF